MASGCLPPDEPAKKPVPGDELIHTWIVAGHILGKGAAVTPAEAEAFHGRTIQIAGGGYVSPWQGTCDDAGRSKRVRTLAEVIGELEMSPAAEGEATSFGMTNTVNEYRLACNDRRKPPPLTMYVSAGKAMTCFNGACYLMKPF